MLARIGNVYNNEDIDRPVFPGYVSIKEAASILGISDKRVYAYVDEGRLPSVWASRIIMIPLEAVQQFKPKISGRPRASVLKRRISSKDNMLLRTAIRVEVKAGQQARLFEQCEAIRQGEGYTFPGTVTRYIAGKEQELRSIEIIFIWRSSVMPDEAERERELEEFRKAPAVEAGDAIVFAERERELEEFRKALADVVD